MGLGLDGEAGEAGMLGEIGKVVGEILATECEMRGALHLEAGQPWQTSRISWRYKPEARCFR